MNLPWFIIVAFYFISSTYKRVIAQDQLNEPPSFLKKPSNSTVKLHTTLVLQCSGTGDPDPTIRWVRYSDKGEQPITTGGRFVVGTIFKYLYVVGIQWEDAGRYGCIALNQHGQIAADAYVTVVTDTPPTWHIKPHNVTLHTGQAYTLPCRTYGYPDPIHIWTRNGFVVAELDIKVLPKDLYFSNAKRSLAGWYTCTASNLLGAVSQSVYVDVVSDPSIIDQPEDVATVRGGTVTMSCGIVASTDSLVIQWSKNDNNLPDDPRINSTQQKWHNTLWSTLKIKKARKRDIGSYQCTVTNSKGSGTSYAAQVSISKVQTPLTVEVPHPTVITTEGFDVELKCVFIGNPTPQVTWYKDGQDLGGTGFHIITAVNDRCDAVLRLASVDQSLSGNYVCRGDGVPNSVDGHISLTVKDAHVLDITPVKSQISTLKDSNITLQCLLSGSAMPDDVSWYKGSIQVTNHSSSLHLPNGTYIALLNFPCIRYSDSGLYICTVQNQYGISSGNMTLTVRGAPEMPFNVRVNRTSLTVVSVTWNPGYNGGADVTFSVQFRINSSNAWITFNVAGNTNIKSLPREEGWIGLFHFRVTAVNQYGSSKPSEIQVVLDGVQSVKADVPGTREEQTSPAGVIVGGIFGGLVVVALIIVVILLVLRKKKKKKKTPADHLPAVAYSVVNESQYSEATYSDGQERCDTYSYVTIKPDATYAMAVGSEYASVPRQKQWEVPKRNVRLDKELGSGHFGKVMKGFLKTKAGIKVVAVKMLKDTANEQQKKEFLAELELMKTLAPHPNIVGLVGCCSKSENPFILVEYCTNGNLRDYLRSTHGSVVYANMAGISMKLTSRDLLSFAWQIARGMSYLASLKLVHRDLAARNILMDTGNVCKVADFGLARDIYEQKQYLKIGEAELPLRWMAIESIFKGVTTTESDVWSFGVLLWEIVTLGANPYPAMARDQVISQLHIGYRMPKPPFCTDELYAVMWQCWQEDPQSRPTFLELGKTLHRLITVEKISIDLSNFDVSYINAPEEQ